MCTRGTVLTRLTIALVVGACSESPLSTHETLEITRAEQRWNERRPPSYSYGVRVSCFCAPQLGRWTEVTVVGHAVVSVKPLTAVLGGPEPLPVNAWPTVPRLFEILKTAREDGDITDITASYDSKLGYPTSIGIACTPDVLECGTRYFARNIKPVP